MKPFMRNKKEALATKSVTTGASPADLPFAPRRHMVGWFDPRLLGLTGIQAVVSQTFGSYADKREMEATLEARVNEEYSTDEEVWLDYVADVGDGFDPTFAVAWHLARPMLEVDAREDPNGTPEVLALPRGQYLIMGGDQVYPAPSEKRYRNQTIGPYEHALPGPPDEKHPSYLLALPGNHDWYDGLTLFIRQFCYPNSIGGWEAAQRRSYFAVRLPHRCWLWGVDTGLRGEIDEPQRSYFSGLEFQRGDRVILCWAVPVWAKFKPNRPENWEVLRKFVEEITDRGARVVLYLSGDQHHFAHYTSPETHWITAGGGGAFAHPTHHLAENIKLPAGGGQTTELTLNKCWPEKGTSWRLLWRVFLFPWRNPSFLLFTATLNALVAWAVLVGTAGGARRTNAGHEHLGLREVASELHVDAVVDGFVRNPVALILAALVIAGLAGFAKPPPGGGSWFRLPGLIHGILAVVTALAALWFGSSLAREWNVTGGWSLFLVLAVTLVVGGLASSMLFGVYLFLTNAVLKMHDNEAFGAIHHPHYKHFLRIQLSPDGLCVYAIGLEYVGRRWDHTATSSGAEPPCRGRERVRPRLIAKIDLPGNTRRRPVSHAGGGLP